MKPNPDDLAAEEYAIHLAQKELVCPSCGESTMWRIDSYAFLAGATHGRQAEQKRILRILEVAGALNDWIEKQIKEAE